VFTRFLFRDCARNTDILFVVFMRTVFGCKFRTVHSNRTSLLTKNISMEHNLSSKANSFSASQIFRIFLIVLRSTLVLSFRLLLGLPSGLFLSGFPTKSMYAPILSLCFSVLYLPHALPVLFLISSPECNLARSTDHNAPHSAIASSPLYLVHCRPKYLFQHSFLVHPQPKPCAQCERTNYSVHTCLSHQLL